MPSLREIVTVSHAAPHLTIHRRDGGEWTAIDAHSGETLALATFSGRIAVDDVYRDGLEDAGDGPHHR